MRYAVERVEWKECADAVSELLGHSFRTPAARYAWLHERNPAGRSALWLARSAAGRPVGTAALHPRRIIVDGRPYRAGLAADFAVDPALRGFGPAVALQRAVLAACESGEFAFLYGFPNRAAQAVFERVGYRAGTTCRLARPLRIRSYLERSGRLPSLARFLAMPLDLGLRLASLETYRPTPRGTSLERVEAFDESFDTLWTRVRGGHAVIGDRDGEYMNWRYAAWPARRYELAVLRRGAEVMATIVWYRIGDIVYVAELLALDMPSFHGLLAAFLRAQRRAGAGAVSFILLGGAMGCATRLGKYGFSLREVERTLMVYVPPAARSRLDRVDRWCLFEGDIL